MSVYSGITAGDLAHLGVGEHIHWASSTCRSAGEELPVTLHVVVIASNTGQVKVLRIQRTGSASSGPGPALRHHDGRRPVRKTQKHRWQGKQPTNSRNISMRYVVQHDNSRGPSRRARPDVPTRTCVFHDAETAMRKGTSAARSLTWYVSSALGGSQYTWR